MYIKKGSENEKLKCEIVVSYLWFWKPMEFSHVFFHRNWKSEIKKGINYSNNECRVFSN
jgi:hypothetical protein